jgi:hypothetical protein
MTVSAHVDRRKLPPTEQQIPVTLPRGRIGRGRCSGGNRRTHNAKPNHIEIDNVPGADVGSQPTEISLHHCQKDRGRSLDLYGNRLLKRRSLVK